MAWGLRPTVVGGLLGVCAGSRCPQGAPAQAASGAPDPQALYWTVAGN